MDGSDERGCERENGAALGMGAKPGANWKDGVRPKNGTRPESGITASRGTALSAHSTSASLRAFASQADKVWIEVARHAVDRRKAVSLLRGGAVGSCPKARTQGPDRLDGLEAAALTRLSFIGIWSPL